MMVDQEFYHYQRIRSIEPTDQHSQIITNESSTNEHDICPAEPINIDTLTSTSHADSNHQETTSTPITTINIMNFVSTWERKDVPDVDDHHNNENHNNNSVPINIIQITFTIPYEITNEFIQNKTIFIIDASHNQLLASLTDICINESSFIINYSTVTPLPHNICLYLLLSQPLSTTEREIIFCRTIVDTNNNESSNTNETDHGHNSGPSEFFILSQCIIILIMMFIIYGVHTARQKNLVNRVSQRVVRSRPYIVLFSNRRAMSADANGSVNPATTLESGLNRLVFHRQLAALTNIAKPIEEQVLAASDLTSTSYDRRASKINSNRDLLNVKELTRRMSALGESPADAELEDL